ncbi:hypothetical protein [Algoriphagus formosus]|uniref:Uncharacterized protein n=1 Tax=Algoriphagus formosus TaxID=2007308 RepID=A0A4R5UWH9_9BACT|nr:MULTISPECIES: hypothetical protein [Algoriphagus]TDK43643.1 hypothetical protein E1898_13680 [Algoriphagus aquimaris]
MGRVGFCSLLFFLLLACNKKGKDQDLEVLAEKFPQANQILFIPLQNSCNSCQQSVGDWLESKATLLADDVLVVLSVEDKFLSAEYRDEYLNDFTLIHFDPDRKYVRENILDGSFPLFSITLWKKNGETWERSGSITPGPRTLIIEQLEMLFEVSD